jgi:hypothetical protein
MSFFPIQSWLKPAIWSQFSTRFNAFHLAKPNWTILEQTNAGHLPSFVRVPEVTMKYLNLLGVLD